MSNYYEKKFRDWVKKTPKKERERILQQEWEEFIDMNEALVRAIPNKQLEELCQYIQNDKDPRNLKVYHMVNYIFTEDNGTRMDPEAKRVFLTLAWAKLDATI